jgi:hypothetical protein
MAFEKSVCVPLTTLDRYCLENDIDHVDLLKMDIQGAEIDAIMGGQETLAKTSYLVMEAVESPEYEGQENLMGLVAALPGTWVLLERLVSDALLVNRNRVPV